MLRRITIARNEQLQYRRRTVRAHSLGHKSLRRVTIRPTDNDSPIQLDRTDERRQVIEPGLRPNRSRLLTDNRGNLEHDPDTLTVCSGDTPGR